jgi:hypothetical protein
MQAPATIAGLNRNEEGSDPRADTAQPKAGRPGAAREPYRLRRTADHANEVHPFNGKTWTPACEWSRRLWQRSNRQPNASAHQRIEPPVWVNRGTHLAADMIERMKAYATQHRLEVREMIDLALRRFFAGEGGDNA